MTVSRPLPLLNGGPCPPYWSMITLVTPKLLLLSKLPAESSFHQHSAIFLGKQ